MVYWHNKEHNKKGEQLPFLVDRTAFYHKTSWTKGPMCMWWNDYIFTTLYACMSPFCFHYFTNRITTTMPFFHMSLVSVGPKQQQQNTENHAVLRFEHSGQAAGKCEILDDPFCAKQQSVNGCGLLWHGRTAVNILQQNGPFLAVSQDEGEWKPRHGNSRITMKAEFIMRFVVCACLIQLFTVSSCFIQIKLCTTWVGTLSLSVDLNTR